MAITPADIEQQTFSPSKHGYDPEEVDAFLEQISSEVDAMLQKIADLKGRLNTAEQQLSASQAQVASLEEQLNAVPSAWRLRRSRSHARGAGRPTPRPRSQISRVLIVAQQSADKLVADARDNAERIRNEADQKAREVIRQALAEKQNELDEIDRLKQSREDFRSEYKKLLQHFMDDADSVFPQQPLSTAPNGSGAAPAATPAARPAVSAPAVPGASAGSPPRATPRSRRTSATWTNGARNSENFIDVREEAPVGASFFCGDAAAFMARVLLACAPQRLAASLRVAATHSHPNLYPAQVATHSDDECVARCCDSARPRKESPVGNDLN
jgi:cell division initiation protein